MVESPCRVTHQSPEVILNSSATKSGFDIQHVLRLTHGNSKLNSRKDHFVHYPMCCCEVVSAHRYLTNVKCFRSTIEAAPSTSHNIFKGLK